MNAIKLFILLLLPALTLGSCSKDTVEEDFVLTTEFLAGSNWRGTMVESDNGQEGKRYDVGLVFYTKSTGVYDTQSKTDPKEEISFKYRIYHKMIDFNTSSGDDPIFGRWIFVWKKGDQLLFERGPGGEYSQKKSLTLIKSH